MSAAGRRSDDDRPELRGVETAVD
ncbi:MAG: hypothetical protein K0Q89_2845, partial [Thermomicrobiales bacterium]|nr:hypothetical protein [Thermomicrobiales bacterium]